VVAPLLFFAGRKDRKSRNVVMALSLAALVGQMVEPAVRAITWRQNPGAKAVTVVNVAIPMAMLYASRNGFGTVGS
jgi:hypothetical protein